MQKDVKDEKENEMIHSIAREETQLIHEENTGHVWASVHPPVQLGGKTHHAGAQRLALLSTLRSHLPACGERALALPDPFTVHGVSWGSGRRAAAVSSLVWAATC